MTHSRLTIRSRLDSFSGWGQHGIELARGFVGLGYHVSLFPYLTKDYYAPVPHDISQLIVRQPQAEDWELILSPLDIAPTEGKRTAYCTMWESSRLPASSIEWLNRCEIVIVPCRYNADCFSASGVIAPIAVCPLGIDPKVFKPSNRKRTRLLKIGCAGGLYDSIQDRKGLDLAVHAFRQAFEHRPEVSLEIKTFPGQTLESHLSNIRILARHLSESELVAWFQSLDLFLCTSSGGGWEFMLHQALACGVPAIAPKHGGIAEYFNETAIMALPFKSVPAGGPYEGTWAQIDADVLVEALKTAKTKEHALQTGSTVARQVACRFTWDRSNRTLEKILIAHGALPEKKVKPVSKLTDEEKILRFYRSVQKVPKLPLPSGLKESTLSNIPTGLGDTVVLTDLPRKAHRHGEQVQVFSTSPFFEPLMQFNPYHTKGHGAQNTSVSHLLDRYDCGNGHTIQRIQRAWGYEPDLRPKGCIETLIQKIPNRIALHFEPGTHSLWQRENVHPRARQIYPETHQQLQAFIRANEDRFEFVEVGKATSGLVGVENKTALAMEATIELLASCEYFIGIISGIYHLAAALDLKTILILNFPHPRRIYLPTLVDFGQIEAEWLMPQSVILHQEGDGELVPRFTSANLERAIHGLVYPYWSDQFLPLIHHKL